MIFSGMHFTLLFKIAISKIIWNPEQLVFQDFIIL